MVHRHTQYMVHRHIQYMVHRHIQYMVHRHTQYMYNVNSTNVISSNPTSNITSPPHIHQLHLHHPHLHYPLDCQSKYSLQFFVLSDLPFFSDVIKVQISVGYQFRQVLLRHLCSFIYILQRLWLVRESICLYFGHADYVRLMTMIFVYFCTLFCRSTCCDLRCHTGNAYSSKPLQHYRR